MARLKRRKAKSVTPARWGLKRSKGVGAQESYLVVIAIVTVVLWQVPLGRTLLFPFTLLGTWFHEMGHGIASMLLGARFEELVIFPDASGFAYSAWPADTPGIFHAITAAAGLLGPSLAGAALIVASRSRKATRAALFALGVLLALSTLIWVRSLAGWIVLPGFSVVILSIASLGKPRLQKFTIEFLGVQGAISIWRDLGYLFSDGGVVDGRSIVSDTGAIADVLLLPYWFWGALLTLAILTITWKALRYASARR